MKKIYALIIMTGLLIIPVQSYASWKTTLGYFKYQKDIEADVSNSSYSMATVSYNNKLYSFINYQTNSEKKVIVRTLTNNSSPDERTLDWSVDKDDSQANLDNLYGSAWQPAPVVFNNMLYLFVEKSKAKIVYSYMENIETGKWSALVDGPTGCDAECMAAVTIGDKLVLLARSTTTKKIAIYWTRDLIKWDFIDTDIAVDTYGSSDWSYDPTYHISALSKTYTENGKVKSKLQMAYIKGDRDVRFAEFSFDASEKMVKIQDVLLANDHDYSSVVLLAGTIESDPLSTGLCTQAYLKKATLEDGYQRHRLIRWELKEGSSTWTNPETNLVPQNYLWADKQVPLSGTIYSVLSPDNVTIRQYQVLIYRGYDDWDHPLNCAYAETDNMKFTGDTSQVMDNPAFNHYIGYFEGLPPFHVNDETRKDPLYTTDLLHISEIEYVNTVTSTHETASTWDVGLKYSCGFAGFKTETSYSFSQKSSAKTEVEVSQSKKFFPEESEEPEGIKYAKGFYIVLKPYVHRAKYGVYAKGIFLYNTYYFYLSDPILTTEYADLKDGLDPADPKTYMHRNKGGDRDLSNYDAFGSTSLSYVYKVGIGQEGGSEIKYSEEESKANVNKLKMKLGAGFGEIFEIEAEGGFEYEMKTSTKNEDKIYFDLRPNAPKADSDIAILDYKCYWIRPTDKKKTWWFHEGQDTTQSTWCVTYDVITVSYENGFAEPVAGSTMNPKTSGVKIAKINTEEDSKLNSIRFSLSQNYPNPFSSATRIKYQVGDNVSATDQTGISSPVRLTVYDISGKAVATLVDEVQDPGSYEISWDASQMPRGLYFYSLQSRDFKDVKKLILMK
jgi:hypothetical protein